MKQTLLLLASLLLCACVVGQPAPKKRRQVARSPAPTAAAPAPSAPEPSPPLASAPQPPPPEMVAPASTAACEGFKLDQLIGGPPGCRSWPDTPAQAVPGIESLSPALRECVLRQLPWPTPNTPPGVCQDGAAQILKNRLEQLGWLDARVMPGERSPGGDQLPRTWLIVQPGPRYRIGAIEAQLSGSSSLSPAQIVAEARKALPAGADWYARSNLEAIQKQLARSNALQMAEIRSSAPNRALGVVDLFIEAKVAPPERNRGPRCPGQLPCPLREICTYNAQKRCKECRCTVKYGS